MILAGCASHRYDQESVYYDNGVGYTDAEWRYETQRRSLESQTYYYNRSWPNQTRPYYRRPNTSYRDDDHGRDRDRNQQRDTDERDSSDRGYRYPEDRHIDRNRRPVERTDPGVDARAPSHDVTRDIERTRDRERARTETRSETQSKSPPRTEPRGDRNVRDVEEIRSRQPDRPAQTGAEQAGDRVRRR